MKAKEKAIQIYDKFFDLDNLEVRCGQFCYGGSVEKKPLAKECALIEVDDIIQLLAAINNDESFNVSKYAVYYQEVKQHILEM